MPKINSTSVVLASTSPRRIELLSQAKIPVFVYAPSADESVRKGESPRKMVVRLAREKAQSVLPEVLLRFGSVIIIGADTIVLAPKTARVLGKPKNRKEALKMLKALSGHTHTVLTGYCILASERALRPKVVSRVVESKVTIRRLSKGFIEKYVDTGEPMDKAGAYAAQGIGMVLIERISGSYTNVVGLPVAQLLMDLEKFGVSPFSGGTA